MHTFDKIENIYTLDGVHVETSNELFANTNLIHF